jgi:hypothetical protein
MIAKHYAESGEFHKPKIISEEAALAAIPAF